MAGYQRGGSVPESTIIGPLTAFGDLQVSELTPMLQQSFEYTVDNTELTTNTTVNGGTVTQADAMAVIRTSATTGSKATMQTANHIKYRAGLGSLLRFTMLFSEPVDGTWQLFGFAEDVGVSYPFKNGYMIGYNGLVFGFHVFKNDTLTTIPLTEWNDKLDGSSGEGTNVDFTKLNVAAINFQYLGAGAQEVHIEDKLTGLFKRVLLANYAGRNIVPSTYNPHFHAVFFVDNKATTADLTIKTASLGYFIQGKSKRSELQQPQQSTGSITKSGVITEVALFTLKSNDDYVGKPNFVDALIERISMAIEAGSPNNLASARLVKNATIGGTPVYVDINSANSTLSVDVSGTTVTGGKELMSVELAGKNDRVFENLIDYEIFLTRGDTITIAVESVASAIFKGSLLAKELF